MRPLLPDVTEKDFAEATPAWKLFAAIVNEDPGVDHWLSKLANPDMGRPGRPGTLNPDKTAQARFLNTHHDLFSALFHENQSKREMANQAEKLKAAIHALKKHPSTMDLVDKLMDALGNDKTRAARELALLRFKKHCMNLTLRKFFAANFNTLVTLGQSFQPYAIRLPEDSYTKFLDTRPKLDLFSRHQAAFKITTEENFQQVLNLLLKVSTHVPSEETCPTDVKKQYDTIQKQVHIAAQGITLIFSHEMFLEKVAQYQAAHVKAPISLTDFLNAYQPENPELKLTASNSSAKKKRKPFIFHPLAETDVDTTRQLPVTCQ